MTEPPELALSVMTFPEYCVGSWLIFNVDLRLVAARLVAAAANLAACFACLVDNVLIPLAAITIQSQLRLNPCQKVRRYWLMHVQF